MSIHSSTNTPQQTDGLVDLVTVLAAVTDHKARILTVSGGDKLPSGQLTPIHHSLQAGVKDWVRTQTAQPMGYVEQLYTFVDGERKTHKVCPFCMSATLG